MGIWSGLFRDFSSSFTRVDQRACDERSAGESEGAANSGHEHRGVPRLRGSAAGTGRQQGPVRQDMGTLHVC